MILLPHAVIDHQGDGSVVIRHDARHLPLPDDSVDLIVTSPPYFALRSYRDDDGHYDGQIGSEDTPEAFLQALDECMVEWRRVLKPGGSCWVNLAHMGVRALHQNHRPHLARQTGDTAMTETPHLTALVDWINE
jgi:DNA modification methylase